MRDYLTVIVCFFVFFCDRCIIHGSVVCGNAHINEGVEINDCVVGYSQSLAEKSKYQSLLLVLGPGNLSNL